MCYYEAATFSFLYLSLHVGKSFLDKMIGTDDNPYFKTAHFLSVRQDIVLLYYAYFVLSQCCNEFQ
jgi:hypothetical protein